MTYIAKHQFGHLFIKVSDDDSDVLVFEVFDGYSRVIREALNHYADVLLLLHQTVKPVVRLYQIQMMSFMTYTQLFS